MSIKFKSDSTLSAEPFPSAPAEKDIITLFLTLTKCVPIK